jgi:hypothetical protein
MTFVEVLLPEVDHIIKEKSRTLVKGPGLFALMRCNGVERLYPSDSADKKVERARAWSC